ncbi:MAG: cytochrome P450 [Actinomycetales bacterium]|nr:cytochrome P450 [Actinomycetales bacterium]
MTTLVTQAVVDESEDAARRERFPIGARVEFDDLLEAGKERVLDELRAREPVSWVPALGGWLVTGRDPARALLAPRADITVESEQNLVRRSLGLMMLTSDADEHRRLRRPFEAPFKPRAVHELFADTVRREAGSLIDTFVAEGRCELGGSFAAPFAVRMAGRMLGLSLGDSASIERIYNAFAEAMVYDGDTEGRQLKAESARATLDTLLHSELARCRRDPSDSITSRVALEHEGLSDEEIVAQLRVIMFGAIETIQASTMNTLLLLLQHPAQFQEVKEDPGLLIGAVAEAIRLIPPVAFVERWTRDEIELSGVRIPAREFVGVSVLAANRDPSTFSSPLSYDVHRPNASQALSFAFGVHTCLGVHLARLETQVAVEELIARLPSLALGDHDLPGGFAFRRPASMTLTWSTA